MENDLTSHSTSTAAPARRKPSVVAVLAVLIPLLAVGVYGIVSSTSADEGSPSDTTLGVAGDDDPATTAGGGGDAAGDGAEGGQTAADAPSSDGAPAAGSTAEEAGGEPSRPRDAGPEGDRTVVTYPQPTVPASGCTRPSGTVTLTLRDRPDPPCLQLGPNQVVVVRNRTGAEISFVGIGVNETIAPGSDARIGRAIDAFGDGRSTFWSPGRPDLSGVVFVG